MSRLKSNRTSSSRIPVEQGIQKKYVDFQSDLAKHEENGLLARLEEMPKGTFSAVFLLHEASNSRNSAFNMQQCRCFNLVVNMLFSRLICTNFTYIS